MFRNWRLSRRGTTFPEVMSSAVGAVARWTAPFLAVAAVAGVLCSADPMPVGTAPGVRLVDEANPLAGAALYVNPGSAAMRAAQSADPPNPQLAAVANTPQAYWMDQASTPAVDAKYIAAAQAAGTHPSWRSTESRIATAGALPPVGSGRATPTAAGSTAWHPPWVPVRRRSSSNPTRSRWPTACRPTSVRNVTT